MRPAHALLVALIMGLLVLSVPLSVRPAPYSMYNPGPAGIAATLDGLEARSLHGPLAGLDPREDALLVVAPRLGYDAGEVQRFRAFLEAGGRALVADSGGMGRLLVQGLGIGADLREAAVFSTSYAKQPAYPLAEDQGVLPGMPERVVLTGPVAVQGPGDAVLAAHPYSWLDLDNDLEPDLGEPRGPWPLAMRFEVGLGEVIVVGDPDLLTAAGAATGGSAEAAEALLLWLSAGRSLVVDEGHRAQADPIGMAPVLAGAAPVRLALATLAVLAGAVGVGLRVRIRRIRPRRRRSRPTPRRDPLQEAVVAELPP